MDKKFFVIAIAIGTIAISTVLQLLIQKQGIDPDKKRLLWFSFAGGVIILAVLALLFLNH